MKDVTGSHIAGTVSFEPTVSLITIQGLLVEMRKMADPKRLIDLHVRGTGKGKNGEKCFCIALHYILEDNKQKTHKRAVHKLIQFLREHLGTAPIPGRKITRPLGVSGWSISSVEAIA